MKYKLFYLGSILLIIGIVWLLTLYRDMEWYVKNVSNDAMFILCIVLAILFAVGGYIIIFAAFDR